MLAVTKEKRYMILDPIPTESIETKPMAQIYLRKKVRYFQFYRNNFAGVTVIEQCVKNKKITIKLNQYCMPLMM